MGILGSVYIALAIFGLGVTVVDLFGALGHHDSDGHHGDGHDAAHDADGHATDDHRLPGVTEPDLYIALLKRVRTVAAETRAR